MAAVVGFLMLSALPLDAWVLAGSHEEQIAFAILLAVVIASIWAHVALARRRRSGQIIAFALGIYACGMVIYNVVVFTRLRALDDPSLLPSLLVSGAMFAALIVAALACLASSKSPLK